MKTFKFYLVAGLMTLSTSAFAQFANTGNNNAGSTKTVDTENYSRVSVSYNPMIVGDDNWTFHGISLGYVHGFSISKSYPIFVETGLNLNYAFKNVEDEDFNAAAEDRDMDLTQTDKYSTLAVGIPVNLAYKFTLNNSDVSISPFVGVNFKFNILGKKKTDVEGELADDWLDYYKDRNGSKEFDAKYGDKDCFNKDDMGGDDYTWNRFQIGWHIGLGINYKALYAGLKYGSDFTELYKRTNTSNVAITLGYNF